jgi:hypothetical protein
MLPLEPMPKSPPKKPKPAPRKSRSGTQWTEEQYVAAGYEQLKLRVKAGTRARLKAIATDAGLSMSDMAEQLIGAAQTGTLAAARK